MTTMEVVMWLSGPTTAVAWWAASRLNDQHTRKLITEEFGQLIDIKLAAFKKDLNSEQGYRRSESCTLMMQAMNTRVAAAEEDTHEMRVAAVRAAANGGNA